MVLKCLCVEMFAIPLTNEIMLKCLITNDDLK